MPESNDSTGEAVALVAYVVIKVAAAVPVVAVGGGIVAGTAYLISRG
jgi:hypothetical protein